MSGFFRFFCPGPPTSRCISWVPENRWRFCFQSVPELTPFLRPHRRLRPSHLGPHLVAATPGLPARSRPRSITADLVLHTPRPYSAATAPGPTPALAPACKLDRGTKSPSASSSSGRRTKAMLLVVGLASLVALSLIRPGAPIGGAAMESGGRQCSSRSMAPYWISRGSNEGGPASPWYNFLIRRQW
jgi:hypothetical protein